MKMVKIKKAIIYVMKIFTFILIINALIIIVILHIRIAYVSFIPIIMTYDIIFIFQIRKFKIIILINIITVIVFIIFFVLLLLL